MTARSESAKARIDKSRTGRPTGSLRDHKQPYATESENYDFGSVKAPTEPDQREAGRARPDGGDKTVGHPQRGGATREKGRR